MKPHPALKLIDLPRPCDGLLYDRTVEKVVTFLARQGHVKSIYQVGSMQHPGISDIDLLIVVSDDAHSGASPFAILAKEERYLFTHSCFLLPESLAPEFARYSLLHGYRRLYGVTWGWERDATDGSDLAALREQTAMEFLVKNLLDLYVQLQYRVVKVRALLQHAKGLRLDLGLLQIDNARSVELADEAVSLIETWFEMRDPEPRAARLASDLLPALRDTVDETSRRVRLYAPTACPLPFAPNMTIHWEPKVTLHRRGVRLPNVLGLEDRRHFNAHHRVNRFRLGLPVNVAPSGSYHALRFDFLRRVRAFVDARFPSFSAPMPPLFYRVV